MKDSDRYGDYRTGQNVVFKYVPDYSSPIMIEGVIKNIVTNGSGKKLEYFEVEAIKSKLMHSLVVMRYTLQLREARSLTGALRS